MSDLPYMPLWVADFLSSGKVKQMTPAHIGAYVMLLMYEWNGTELLDDDDYLAKLTQCDGHQEWAELSNLVRACFEQRDGRLFNPRLEKERKRIADRHEKLSEAGKKSGKVRRKKRLSTRTSFKPPTNKSYLELDTELNIPPPPHMR